MKGKIIAFASILTLFCSTMNYAQSYVLDESKYKDALDLIFSFQMKEAIDKTRELKKKDINDPACYFLEAVILYYTSIIQKKELSDELYSSNYIKKEFDNNIEKAIEIVKQFLKADNSNNGLRLILASSYDFQGLFALNHDEFMNFYKKEKEGREEINKILNSDKNYYDAYLGAGLYNLFSSLAPWYIRWLISSDGKDEGLMQMQKAIDNAKYNFTKYFAMMFLDSFYYLEYLDDKDKNTLQARIDILEKFLTVYTDNFAVKLALASCYEIVNQNKAIQLYSEVIDYAKKRNNERLFNYASYFLGEYFFEKNDRDKAFVFFNNVLSISRSEGIMKERSIIKLAEIYTINGDKKKAISLLDEVISKTTDKKVKRTAVELKDKIE